jgi:hypothetical protein
MMKTYRWIARINLALVASVMVSPVVSAQAPQTTFAALRPLETGLWQFDSPGRSPQRLCLIDPAILFQLAHNGPACRRFVIANGADEATVHYSCGAAGWGRTTIRVETPRLAQISTQGIKQSRPFAFKGEARHVGDCQSVSSAGK